MPFKHVPRAAFPAIFSQGAATIPATASMFVNEPGAAGAGGGEYYEILSAVGVWDVVGGAGAQVDLMVVPSGTALAGGTSVIVGTGGGGVFNLAAGARAPVRKALVTNRNLRLIAPGAQLAAVFGGTLTALLGLNVTVWLQAVRGVRSR